MKERGSDVVTLSLFTKITVKEMDASIYRPLTFLHFPKKAVHLSMVDNKQEIIWF